MVGIPRYTQSQVPSTTEIRLSRVPISPSVWSTVFQWSVRERLGDVGRKRDKVLHCRLARDSDSRPSQDAGTVTARRGRDWDVGGVQDETPPRKAKKKLPATPIGSQLGWKLLIQIGSRYLQLDGVPVAVG